MTTHVAVVGAYGSAGVAAEHRYASRDDPRLDGLLTVDTAAVVARKDEHTATFAGHRRAAVDRLADRDGVELLRETARFVDDRRLAVGDQTSNRTMS